MSQQLPFFVYGTLRRGQCNHRIAEGMPTACMTHV